MYVVEIEVKVLLVVPHYDTASTVTLTAVEMLSEFSAQLGVFPFPLLVSQIIFRRHRKEFGIHSVHRRVLSLFSACTVVVQVPD